MKRAFTLIELLIVVAIIAILAAIAVPNFLEAQVRAKVSRVKTDLRTYATGVEAYTVDHSKPPREFNHTYYGDTLPHPETGAPVTGLSGIMWHGLSTPIAYVTQARQLDIFQDKNLNAALDEQYFTYQDMKTRRERNPSSAFWNAAEGFYGTWRMMSVGPDRLFRNVRVGTPTFTNSAQLVYDSTNGTLSTGNIFRTQAHSTDVQPKVGAVYTSVAGNATLLGAH